jgi:hypothetical protein
MKVPALSTMHSRLLSILDPQAAILDPPLTGLGFFP